MICEQSAGIILYRKLDNKIEYLLLKYAPPAIDYWGAPKGHLEEGESCFMAAIRETQEEAGLKAFEDYTFFDRANTIEETYQVNSDPNHLKKVVYWLGFVSDPNVEIKVSSEHTDFKWLDLDNAIQLAYLSKNILLQADALLKKVE
jgi:8-oxo-dGTP pyrophosphatase MutT (NUDIX family)